MQSARVEIAEYEKTREGFATLHWLTHHIYSVHGLRQSKLVEDPYLYSRFQRVFSGLFEEELQRRGSTIESDTLAFVIGGIFSVIHTWA